MSARCGVCTRELRVGESAWASDWMVVDTDGTRREVRYMCEDCSGEAS